MSQKVEKLVRSGQHRNLMIVGIPSWESTITAGILMGMLEESGATPLTQMRSGSTALFQNVRMLNPVPTGNSRAIMIVRMAIHSVHQQ